MVCFIPVRIDLSQDLAESGIYTVLARVKPEWTENIQVKPLQGGFINQSRLCSHNDDKLVIRVNNDVERIPFVDRDYEALLLQHLDALQLVPKFYARFQNGLVYEYVNGEHPSSEDMQNEDFMNLIVNKLYRIHTSNAPKKSNYSTRQNSSVYYHAVKEVVEALDEELFDEDMREKFLAVIPSIQSLKDEAKICRQHMDEIYRSFPHVLCHLDVRPPNIVYNKRKQKLEFLDLETADYAPALQDFASLLEPLDKSTWRKWIKLYLSRAGLPQEDVVIESWYTGILHSLSLLYLSWCCWGLINITRTEDEGWKQEHIEFATDCYKKYMDLKGQGHQTDP